MHMCVYELNSDGVRGELKLNKGIYLCVEFLRNFSVISIKGRMIRAAREALSVLLE